MISGFQGAADDARIDRLVHELHGLTEEEIKLVEGAREPPESSAPKVRNITAQGNALGTGPNQNFRAPKGRNKGARRSCAAPSGLGIRLADRPRPLAWAVMFRPFGAVGFYPVEAVGFHPVGDVEFYPVGAVEFYPLGAVEFHPVGAVEFRWTPCVAG